MTVDDIILAREANCRQIDSLLDDLATCLQAEVDLLRDLTLALPADRASIAIPSLGEAFKTALIAGLRRAGADYIKPFVVSTATMQDTVTEGHRRHALITPDLPGAA